MSCYVLVILIQRFHMGRFSRNRGSSAAKGKLLHVRLIAFMLCSSFYWLCTNLHGLEKR